jgi:hypothetical protein
MTLTLNIIMGGALTGAAFNSARALGPMVAIGNFTNAWLLYDSPARGCQNETHSSIGYGSAWRSDHQRQRARRSLAG